MKKIHVLLAVLALAIPAIAYAASQTGASDCCATGAECCPGPCCADGAH